VQTSIDQGSCILAEPEWSG